MTKAKNISTIILGSGHSLIIGNIAKELAAKAVDAITEKGNQDIGKFGLFNMNSADMHTYFPDVTPEELTPSDEDMVMPVFRALSSTIVNRLWDPVDFSKPGVLDRATKLLVGQTVYSNHDVFVGNELGVVADAFWQKAYKTSDGIEVPAGINIQLMIDGKAHPNVARKLNMNPPAIHSNSVSVTFEWEPSHPDLEDFRYRVGTYDENGELIRRVATKIIAFNETSLVAHGADVYAQKVGADGQIVNPHYAVAKYSAREGLDSAPDNSFNLDFKSSLTLQTSIPPEPTYNHTPVKIQNKMNKTANLILSALGITVVEATDTEPLRFAFGDQSMDETALETFLKGVDLNAQATIDSLNAEVLNLKGTIDSLKSSANPEGALALTAMRTRIKELYSKAGNSGEIEGLEEANFVSLGILEEKYTNELNLKFPMKCNSCGSTELSRKSSSTQDPGTAGGSDDPPATPKSADEVYSEFVNRRQPSTFFKDEA